MKNNFYRTLRSYIGGKRRLIRFNQTYARFRKFTMISREVYVDNLMLADKIRNTPGCVIECGVWRGGMSAGLASSLGPERHYFLFDSFEGLPPAKEVDGDSALDWQRDKESPGYHDNCTAGPEFAREAMALSGARKFDLVKGWFSETLSGFVPPEPIALLRLDGDWYDSTMVCLESLFDYVVPNGLILLDDYYVWDGCSRAVHDFLSRRSAAERVRNCGETCVLEKSGTITQGAANRVEQRLTRKPI